MAEYNRYTDYDYSTDYLNMTYNYATVIDYDACENIPVSPYNAMASRSFVGTVYSMYCPILIIAILGNATVCFIVTSTPRMQTVSNFFIANLAVSDLLMTVFDVPFTFIQMFILNYWPFGAAMCPIVIYTQAVSMFVNAYTLVAISIDQYVAIMWPLKPRLTKRYATFTICMVWLFAIVTALPIPIVGRLIQPAGWYKQCDKYICGEDWPTLEQHYTYRITLMILQFVIPLAVLIFTNTSIAIVVWCKRIPGEAENSRDLRMARLERKMIKMMLVVVIVFILCWLPLNTLVVVDYFDYEIVYDMPAFPYILLVLHWLAMSHVCYNPIIYCCMNARFRAGFLQVWTSILCYQRCTPLATHTSRTGTAFGLTGSDSTENTLLHHSNRCTHRQSHHVESIREDQV